MGLSPSSTRPIFCFTVKLLVPGFGLVFRRWSYTTTLITFDLTILPYNNDLDSSVYLNTGCEVTLVDKA